MRSSRPAGERRLGRFLEPAMWVLIALGDGPLSMPTMFDSVRRLDGPIGHGTLFGAVARLERLDVIESTEIELGRRAYRLTGIGDRAAAAIARLQGRSA